MSNATIASPYLFAMLWQKYPMAPVPEEVPWVATMPNPCSWAFLTASSHAAFITSIPKVARSDNMIDAK